MLGSNRQGRHAAVHARRARTGTSAQDTASGPVLVAAAADAPEPYADDAIAPRRPAGGPRTAAGTPPRMEAALDEVPDRAAPPRDARPTREAAATRRPRALLRGVVPRDRTLTVGGAKLRVLVLGCTPEDTTVVDLASRSLLRLRIPWPPGHAPDLSAFDVVEAALADDPECDDLAQPEAATVAALPRRVGRLQGRRTRAMLTRLAATHDGPLLGFHGPSAPYWDFRGLRPSVSLVHPTRGPQLLRRRADGSTWVRFGWERDDVWLPVEDLRAVRALDASRGERLTGKPLATALGFPPHFLLVAVSRPREGHCYKICQAVLPKG